MVYEISVTLSLSLVHHHYLFGILLPLGVDVLTPFSLESPGILKTS